MITLTHGERCRTPFRRDPRPSKTHGGPPWPPDHIPRPGAPAGAGRSDEPSTLASEILLSSSKMGLFYAYSQLRSSMRRRLFIAVV